MIELGVRWFDSRRPVGVTRGDARLALRGRPGSFDQVVVDCYANNMEVPPHLATMSSSGVALRLTPGGWISVNAGGFGVEDQSCGRWAEPWPRRWGAVSWRWRCPSVAVALLARLVSQFRPRG